MKLFKNRNCECILRNITNQQPTNLKVCDAEITVESLMLSSDVLVQLLELPIDSRLLPLVADGAAMLEEPVEVGLDLLRLEAGSRPPVHVEHVVVHVLELLALRSMNNL